MGPDDLDYALPDDAIAQEPVEPRSASRLLVDRGTSVEHHLTAELPDLLSAGDVVVVNDTRVLPARLHLTKPTGGRVEVLLLEPMGEGHWHGLVRPSRRVAPGTRLAAGEDLVVVVGDDLGDGRRLVTLETEVPLTDVLDRHGEMPLPPYLRHGIDDPERYQTVYARRPASAAAPTAGLHLTSDVLDRLTARGIEVVEIELVVGLDTFRPMAVDDLDDHVMHTEAYDVPAATWAKVTAASRVVAIGTTTVRALESVAAHGELAGRTDLFIRAPYDFAVVDVMLTNFHLPRSSLLAMVHAFIGDRWRTLYDIALDEGYRFLSFGDAMLLERRR